MPQSFNSDLDKLADLEPAGKRFPDVGHQLHLRGVVQVKKHLAGRDGIADIDALVHHDAVDGRQDGCVAQDRLSGPERLLGLFEVGLG